MITALNGIPLGGSSGSVDNQLNDDDISTVKIISSTLSTTGAQTYGDESKVGKWDLSETDQSLFLAPAYGDTTKLIDGLSVSNVIFGSVPVLGKSIVIEFEEKKIVKEVKIIQSAIGPQGTWTIQGFNDSLMTWSNISDSFLWGSASTTTKIVTNDVINGFKKIRLNGVSGNTSPSAWLYEINAMISPLNPALKINAFKTIQASTSGTNGGEVLIPHGLNSLKIISVSASINTTGNTWVVSSNGSNTSVDIKYDNTNVFIKNTQNDSSQVFNKNVKITIFHEIESGV